MYLTAQTFNSLSLSLPPECLHYGAVSAGRDHNTGHFAFAKQLSYKGKKCRPFELVLSSPDKAIFNPLVVSDQFALAYAQIAPSDQGSLRSARFGRLMTAGEPKIDYLTSDVGQSRGL